ncbi:MAG TPA: hypothetical protein VEO01_28930 [Pseudonocardiaceae bacterium]|nr:hypothetical protein [Pseudonocardiaceae bacterium]
MADILGWLADITLVAWIAAEVVMQVRQYRMGGRSEGAMRTNKPHPPTPDLGCSVAAR